MKKTDFSESKSCRKDLLEFAEEQYGTEPEYLWASSPDSAILRHSDNQKWYALFMEVQRNRLGLSGEDLVDVLDIKCDPILSGSLRMQEGFLPAYHMNKGNWISILLDGTVEKEAIFPLLEMSFELTASKGTKQKSGHNKIAEWIVPANPKYYDLEKAFSENNTILWKQSSHIAIGDMVYLYVAAPYSAILYQCKAEEVDIPYQYDDGKVSMEHVMKIRLLHRFDRQQFPFNKLKEYGIFAVRGPRRVPESLSKEIGFAVNASL